ncbi:MAG: pyridoxine 5'-phosphate synthase [Alphaproteobacteria bacterium]|nr:pyridoxine 5'-phosphate synthase [Alphaproteobacteria bacterium]
MTALSVNVNKVAWLRNSRDGSVPSVLAAVEEIIAAGADGITVHPRPDERHITRRDSFDIADIWLKKYKDRGIEYNIEGYPDDRYCDLLRQIKPSQATLVPDAPRQKTSDHGYQLADKMADMTQIIKKIKSYGPIRVSLFVDPDPAEIERVKQVGADRIELYTGPYAMAVAGMLAEGRRLEGLERQEGLEGSEVLRAYVTAAARAVNLGLGINAGHDLNLDNLPPLLASLPRCDEVSIGHALVADSLWWGFRETIRRYRVALDATKLDATKLDATKLDATK